MQVRQEQKFKEMKSMRLIMMILVVFVTATANAQDSEERKVSSFEEIRVSEAITVYLKAGADEKVRVEARGIDLDEVITEVSGSRLKIHLDDGNHRNHAVKVYVTYKQLTGITASSASGVFSDGVIKGNNLDISVSSAADVEVDVDVNDLEVSVSSSGDLQVTGKSKYLTVSASSAGGVDAYDLDASIVKVRASSAGSAKVSASQEIDARASSGASIRYKGSPSKSQTDSSSGGSVRKSN